MIVATFASLIARVQQVIDAAARHGRTRLRHRPQHDGQRRRWRASGATSSFPREHAR